MERAYSGHAAMREYIVIMGARVLPDGRMSGALRRRAQAALELANRNPNARILATGGVGECPPSEAEAVRDWLVAQGIARDRILIEPDSLDTLQSAENCAAILLEQGSLGRVTVCSDRFHVIRSALLLRVFGVRARPGWIASGRRDMGRSRWLYYWLRDFVGLVWDVPIAVVRRSKRPR
jgi:uncharacterized SAM-binding protein YcdF (DUF218 family)